jgi:23S rRNA (adenine2503-C2)-methyltransferase
LTDHDRRSLGRWLAKWRLRGDEPRACHYGHGERVAGRVLQYAFAKDAAGDVTWTDDALREAGIGSWARGALLGLDPRVALSIAERAPSGDGTERLLLRTHDGGLIEAVIIPASAGRHRPRITLCLSSQVGCARACSFCETGVMGLERQLSAGEIVDQYRIAARLCRPVPIDNIVFMGMGEPFDNLREVVRAISLLCDHQVFSFPPSHITVSTVGIADRFADFFAGTRAELAISLNAPNDELRSRIMPINARFDLDTLRAALLDAMPPGRRVLFQYALFDGFNDALEHADALADYVKPVPCRVNVIPANPGPDPLLVAPSDAHVDAFVERLRAHGVTTLLRRPRGRDVGGACGQLAGKRRAVQDARWP